jgi:penicillin amidase
MNPEVTRRLRLLASALTVIVLLALVAAGWYYARLRASLPQLDGTARAAGLGAVVTVERDSLGVPTVRGQDRADVTRALGWLHGQDRFFQMDILRRAAAGELSELLGPAALKRDRTVRLHGFRALAATVVGRLDPAARSVLETYAAGVNAGLGALGEHPFEYLVLREPPRAWLPEDTLLVVYAMTLDLQEEEGAQERRLMTLRDQLGLEGLAFFAPLLAPGDAALDGTTAPLPAIPGPKVLNLRARKVGGWTPALPEGAETFPFPRRDPELAPGSNAFALAGAHTASGAALLANDMHLDYGLPNIWYRASLEYAGRRVTGVTLPGTPVVVAGSNGRVAWGFTNGYVDTGDLVIVEPSSIAPTLYRAPGREELVPFEERRETIKVKGSEPVVAEYRWTIWGPIVGEDERRKPLAHRWVMHDPAAVNLELMRLEGAATTEEAIGLAHQAGIPAQNILLADAAGQIAWTIAGRLPKRVGFDGRLPVTWTYGDRRWEGLLPPEQVPVIRGADSSLPGRLWSANHRHVGGDALVKLGDGAYRRASRAAQIRDDLAALAKATPPDLLAVQKDDRARFLAPWQALLLETLNPSGPAATGEQAAARASLRAAAATWEGRAAPGSASYRLAREFRRAVINRVFTPIFASCVEADPQFDWREFPLEDSFWVLWREKPTHLLSPEFARWEDLALAAADDVLATLDRLGLKPAEATWGERNRVQIRHPFARLHGWLAPWLAMPADALPGDADMPGVQSPTHGPSERLVVSPGREQEGIFHMPGGQSGHPLSPFFRAGHEAWVRGEPSPFLPGATRHTLRLQP